jgi:prepilin-type N-terminal cleavage/methylation domain-containing protein
MSRASRAQGGFTLMEVLITLTILAFMMTMGWATTSRTATTKIEVEQADERNHEIRMAMTRMARDFSHMYLSGNERNRDDDPRTLLTARRGSPVSEVWFSTLGHDVLWADAAESEQTMITYEAERDPEDSSKTNIVRRELRRLPTENFRSRDVPADVDLLVRDVVSLEFQFFDWRDDEWQVEWDTTAADRERGRLPSRVRIELVIASRGGREITFTTQARVALQEELNFLAD